MSSESPHKKTNKSTRAGKSVREFQQPKKECIGEREGERQRKERENKKRREAEEKRETKRLSN